MASESPVTFRHRLEPEDQARADFYALLARLFSGPPDAPLLRAIASAPPLAPAAGADGGDAGSGLARAWDRLKAASAAMDVEAAADEYQTLFVGVGRSEVSLYASHYLGAQSGRPLAELRSTLARLGLARKPGASEFEDHAGVVLEVARMLVAGDGERPPADLAAQRNFLAAHLFPWVFDCCAAIGTNSVANYYRRVAEFAASFLAIERDSLAME
jgi:TorA maturation chaperone TorD